MIIIKDKTNYSLLYIPRNDKDLNVDYVTVGDLEVFEKRLQKKYATIDYVNEILMSINKQLEKILE